MYYNKTANALLTNYLHPSTIKAVQDATIEMKKNVERPEFGYEPDDIRAHVVNKFPGLLEDDVISIALVRLCN